MRLVYDNERTAALVKAETGGEPPRPFSGFLVLDGDTNVRGCVVMSGYMPDSDVEMSAIGRLCWTPTVVRQLARIAFIDWGCRRVSAQTRASNLKARAGLEAMGFQYEGERPDFFPNGESAVLYGLRRTRQKLVRLDQ